MCRDSLGAVEMAVTSSTRWQTRILNVIVKTERLPVVGIVDPKKSVKDRSKSRDDALGARWWGASFYVLATSSLQRLLYCQPLDNSVVHYVSSLAAAYWPLLASPRTAINSKGARGLCVLHRLGFRKTRGKSKLPAWLNRNRMHQLSTMGAVIVALSPTMSSYQSLRLSMRATAVYVPRFGFALAYFPIYDAESWPV